ncbi:hypothetical protein RHSIM_Rhsim06G0227300 [Rhododendron simsii]|uniref:Small ribosomal subunit protein uS10 domain-containing protein n=1 Tax=Rhododendron simsii TaxID=118357 RepID=A0A834GQR7_RHOSS|nr:hypothetical protein RHSIM_Rhsim06G0227300 [Rhododendron simsii]
MAVSSLSSTICPSLPVPKFSAIAAKPKLSILSFPSSAPTLKALKPYRPSKFRVFAAPEMLDVEEALGDESGSVEPIEVEDPEAPESSPLGIGIDIGKSAPKQKIRIKLRSYWVPLIEDSCKQILDAARRTDAKTIGPVPLPTKKRIYCVLKSPHVHKDARFHFEIRTHRRLIDILFPTSQTIDALMVLDIPPGVDVEVKL